MEGAAANGRRRGMRPAALANSRAHLYDEEEESDEEPRKQAVPAVKKQPQVKPTRPSLSLDPPTQIKAPKLSARES